MENESLTRDKVSHCNSVVCLLMNILSKFLCYHYVLQVVYKMDAEKEITKNRKKKMVLVQVSCCFWFCFDDVKFYN